MTLFNEHGQTVPSGCFHLLEWYLKNGYRYRCKLCGALLKIASGRYPTEPKPEGSNAESS